MVYFAETSGQRKRRRRQKTECAIGSNRIEIAISISLNGSDQYKEMIEIINYDPRCAAILSEGCAASPFCQPEWSRARWLASEVDQEKH